MTGPRAPRPHPAYDQLPRAERLRATTGPDYVAGYPLLVVEWHPTNNGDLFPYQAARGSIRKVWWRCSKDPAHEWEGRVAKRVAGSGCPACAGRQTSSLAVTHPELVAEWHPTKNGRLRPEDVTAGVKRAVWWKCAAAPDHEWQRSIRYRAWGGPCPFCRKHETSKTNVITADRKLAKQWHPTKNGGLEPGEVRCSSSTPVWWKCSKGPDHEWRTSPRKRADHACPFCAGARLSVTNAFAVRHPELAGEFHPTQNGKLRAEMLPSTYREPLWWRCGKHPDAAPWRAAIRERLRGRGTCPACGLEARSLGVLHPKLAKEFHPTRNRPLTVWMVALWDRKSHWWRCTRGHVWSASVEVRICGRGCPTCHPRPRGDDSG